MDILLKFSQISKFKLSGNPEKNLTPTLIRFTIGVSILLFLAHITSKHYIIKMDKIRLFIKRTYMYVFDEIVNIVT